MTEVLDESNLPYVEKVDLHDHDKLIELASQLETHRIFTTPITLYSATPKVLVVVDVAQEGSKDPIDEKTSNLLKKALGEMSMDYAVGNIATIIGRTYEGSSSGNPEEGVISTHTESEEVQWFYDDHLLKFVEQHDIKTIVCLGQAAYQNFSLLPQSYYHNLSATKLVNTFPHFGENGLIITINYHPQFILKNGGLESDSFSAFQNKFKRTLQKSNVDMDVTSKYDIKLVGLDQLDEVLALFAEERDVGTDYEANDLDPWNITTRPTGFSISTDKVARYIIVDRPFTNEEKEKITGFFKKKAPWTYNCKYEMKMTWAKMDKFVMMNDVLVLCTVDGHRGSLKNNARFYLNADLWEEDTSFIVDTYNVIFGKLASIKKLAPDLFKEVMSTGDYRHLITELQKGDCKAHRYRQIEDQFTQLLNIITPDEISQGLKWYPKAWGAVPARILGEYCCMDSIYTVQLKKLLWDKHKSYYQYYIIQSWLACVMESYGMVWDDNYAGGLEVFYCEDAIQDLYKLIMLFDIDDKYKEFATKILHAEIAPDSIVVNDLEPKAYNVKIQDIYCKLDALKSVFNPLSNTAASQAKFWDSYKTDSSLPILLLYEISTSLSQTTQIPEEDQVKLVDRTSLDQTLNNLVEYLNNNPRHSESVLEILSKLEISQNSLFKGFASEVIEFHYGAHSMYSPALSCKACKTMYEDRELEGKMCPKCDSDKVKVTRGVDADNKETWTSEFWMMYYLRRFKKVNKSRSTYIQGQVGRGNVYLGRYTDFRQPPVRLGSYWEIKEAMPDYKLKPNERWIMNTDFNSNAAETLRWTARIHTVPWNCILGSEKIPVLNESEGEVQMVSVESLAMLPDSEKFFTFSAYTDNLELTPSTGYYARHVKDVPTMTFRFEGDRSITVSEDQRLLTSTGDWIYARDVTHETDLHLANLDFLKT